MGSSVDVDADVAVGVNGNDDRVGDGLPVRVIDVGDVGATGGAGVHGDVATDVADLAVDGGDVERHCSHAAGRDVAGTKDAEAEWGAAVGAVADLGGADTAGVVTGVGHASWCDRREGVVGRHGDGDRTRDRSVGVLGLYDEGVGACGEWSTAEGPVGVQIKSRWLVAGHPRVRRHRVPGRHEDVRVRDSDGRVWKRRGGPRRSGGDGDGLGAE